MPHSKQSKLTGEELLSVVEDSPNPPLVLNREGVLHYGSQSLEKALGYFDTDDRDWRLDGVIHPEDESALLAGLAQALDDQASCELGLRLHHQDGSWRYFVAKTQALFAGSDRSYVALHLREKKEEVKDGRTWDKLTGLPNRAVLVDRVQRSMSRARRRNNYSFALAALNLDRLKLITDGLGRIGTGYSSLKYLHRLPADALKVDRSFVSQLPDDKEADVLVRAIVDLAHNLGLHVVAEGIETQAQLDRLKELGCEYGQGFLFARPAEAEKIEPFLVRNLGG